MSIECREGLDDPATLTQILQYLPGMNAQVFHRLLSAFGSVELIWKHPLIEVQSILPPRTRRAFAQLRGDCLDGEVATQWQLDRLKLARNRVHVLTWYDKHYPQLLKNIVDAPPVLYVKGDLKLLNTPQLALVGSRNMTAGGAENALRFARYLAETGFTITSGLATGIDAQAHRGALQAKGKTVAVMATGVDRVYPTRHQSLADDILTSGGCLVTEFLPGTPPLARYFPQRNRIVSGLSLGVLVAEAALKSGSLITARLALEHNREVFAIPGSIHNPQSRGCHELIRQGATLVESAFDIAEQLQGWVAPRNSLEEVTEESALPNLTSAESSVLDWLGFEFCSVDQLIETSGWPTEKLLAELMSLQLKGVVAQRGSGYQRL